MLLVVRVVRSVCMAWSHLGSAMGCLTEVGSRVARKILGLRLLVRDLVTKGWVLVTGGGVGSEVVGPIGLDEGGVVVGSGCDSLLCVGESCGIGSSVANGFGMGLVFAERECVS